MTTEQRLTNVEDNLESVKQLLTSAARYAESANQKIDRVSDRIGDLTTAQANTQARIDDLTTAQDRTQALLDRLGTKVDQLGSRVDQLVESQAQTFARFDRTLDTWASNQVAEREARDSLREDLEILYQTVQRSGENTELAISQMTERVNQLTQDLTASVEDLVGMISQLANDAAADRAVIRENQAEIRRIWEYLLHQSSNGSGE